MKEYLKPFDCEGNEISIGDDVLYISVTDQLLKGLPKEDQEAIKAQEGKIMKVLAFDEHGYVEMEFQYERKADSEITFHTIWAEPRCLKKVK